MDCQLQYFNLISLCDANRTRKCWFILLQEGGVAALFAKFSRSGGGERGGMAVVVMETSD